ncbi:hypothetical protein AC578_1088 [Pseudocercospora eumusae]|uniref:Uncharacterized protein n=1 Tax=Pseudocercospora eumusae TaxID=321146 RepID=A0A139HTE4_9PEZI|nr:hypothetical protein AC578_1088 [Pseudocercospora eumusae]
MTAATSSVDRAKLRPPPLQTNYLHQSHTEDSPISPRPQSPYDHDRQPEVQERPATKGGHQPFVLTDPVAFRYLEEDASTHVLQRRRELRGYECYIVEQWTTSRVHPTFMITNYTGDDKDIVVVDVLSVPTDEHAWSPRLRVYFKALNQYHARRRETPLGVLMVTNLSGFPSSLAIIPVPDGDVRRHRFDFLVNEDLKRLGCSGRVGLTLAQPAASTVAKFHQLYRTSDKNDIYKSVLELIKLCQSALMLFDKLEIDYSDGLLCDVTERAINDWWVEIGSDHYNVEPHDGILGPTTVAGLLGLLMGARNRLHAINAPVSKDPFDVEAMKQGIGAFQKQQRIQRTRRLDRRTLDRLHKATQKVAEKERWAVPKAVKSTVAELSGRGGEMIGDIVGRRDRASIAEVETVDIDRFVQLVYGDRAKWLWLGKPMKKSKVPDGAERVPEEVQGEPALNKGLVFKPDEHGGYTWTSGRKSTFDGMPPGERRDQEREYHDFITPALVEEKDEFEDDYVGRPSLEVNRPSMFHRATTLKDKPKAGLDKVKGAVGLRGHKPKSSVDEPVPRSPVELRGSRRPLIRRSHTSPLSSPSSPELSSVQHTQRLTPAAEEQSNRLNVALGDSRPDTADTRSLMEGSNSRLVSQESFQASGYSSLQQENSNVSSKQQQRSAGKESTGPSVEASVAGSIYKGIDLNGTLPTGPETEAGLSTLLKRTISYSQYVEAELQPEHGGLAPRHLSFSLAEESLLTWEPLGQDEYDPFSSARAQLAEQHYMAAESKHLRRMINALQYQTATWTSKELHQLREMLERLDQDQDTLDELHQPHLRAVKELQTHAGAIQREEKDRLEEGVKEIETLAAKLEYEIGGLRGKVEDVEAGVSDFEKSVGRVEGRVAELEKEAENGSKQHSELGKHRTLAHTSAMRLRLRIERNELPAVQVLWSIEPTEIKNTISQFLERVNERFPLEGNTWDISDYSVMVAGYEATHYSELGNTFKDEDEVVIKPLGFAELRTRTLTGRDQITQDGRHLLDGVPFGKPLLKRPRRPDVRIPPRKKQRLEEEDDDEQALVRVQEDILDEDDEDEEDDGDFEEDAPEDAVESESESDDSDESSEEDSGSSSSDSSSDSSESENESEDESDSSSEASWDGIEERDKIASVDTVIVTDNLQPTDPPAAATPKQHEKVAVANAASSTPPHQGQSKTKDRNVRRRDTKKLKFLKDKGVLPPNAALKDLYEHDMQHDRQIMLAKMEHGRQQLLDQIAQGGIDVSNAPATNGQLQPEDDDEPLEEESIRRPEEPTVAASAPTEEHKETPPDVEQPDPYVDDAAEESAAPTRRARLDLKGMNRMVFSSLGLRTPKTQADRDALQKKLAARPKKSLPVQAAAQQSEQAVTDDEEPEAWRQKVSLTAVECLDEGVELSAPDFPFQQRWDPQYQYTKKLAASSTKSKLNKKRRVSAQQNGSHDDYVETYDKYNQDGGGDALNYDDPDDEEEDFDDSYWEEGALLEQDEDAESEIDHSDGFPKLPKDTTTLPALAETDAKEGDLVVFEELSVSAATNWAPQTVSKLAKLGDKTDEGWTITEAPSRAKQYDEDGNRVYSKFEMDAFSENGEEEEEPRLVQWVELQGIRLLKRHESI